MTGTEWLLLIVVVIGVPLVIAIAVTVWTLEMARQRNKKHRPQPATPVKRQARRVVSPQLTGESAKGSEPIVVSRETDDA